MTTLGKFLASLFVVIALAASPAYAAKIDINKATASELQQLSGVGEKKAKAIIAYRKKHGKFKNTDDLLKVPGIGGATISKNLSSINLPKGKNKLTAAKASTKKKASVKKDKLKAKSSKAKDKKAKLKEKSSKAKDKKGSLKKKAKKPKKEKK